ncbi:MAG: zinc ribbon domain-containing protein [Candidatus Methanodesulfokora sp.]
MHRPCPQKEDNILCSSLCPICGGKLAPNGHRVLKCSCGFQGDRDIVACLNLLRMRGVPFPLKAINEALRAEMERIVNVNYPRTEG